MPRQYKDLLDVLPKDVSMVGYCSRGDSPDNYWTWEKEIAQPALEALGYTVLWWATGERDSFGPLSRIAAVVNTEGLQERLMYG